MIYLELIFLFQFRLLVFGFGTGDLKLGYSYDITLNQLGALNTGGSHEFSVKYLWDVARRRDPRPPYHPCVEY